MQTIPQTAPASLIRLSARRLAATAFALLLFCCSLASSSAQETLPDSKGKDFWFCFIPNFHTNFLNDQNVQETDSLYVFVVAEKPCSISLRFSDYEGRTFRIDSVIRDPRQVLTIGMPFFLKELIGFNVGGPVNRDIAQNGKIARQSFHLTSTEEVTVYALNQAFTTSDAFLVLPTDANGTDYMVMSYNADLQINARDASPTPSQYAVVATEDNTEIRFQNTANIALDTLTYRTLNKGDVYLVQSLVNNEAANDLTGSRITSTKPIAVFSGHQRATIPLQLRQALVSRDVLIEQLPPINTWGRTALLTPYPLPADATPIGRDRYRVIAAFDSTRVFVNGAQVTMLMTGQRYEADLDNAKTVRSNNPILVAQFKKTSGDVPPRGVQSDYNLSDPFMMLIPPAEQFLKSYRFINAQAYERDEQNGRVNRVYQQQYLTVVAPTTSVPRILLDGTGIPAGRFTPIPSSVYSYATLPMTDGVHAIEADTGIGIYVFGYGPANSYGYIGGMSFKRYDFPQITARIACATGRGVVYDTTLKDSRIIRVEPIRDSMFNVNINVLPFVSPADSVEYGIRLIDDTQDGWFWMEAEDQDALISRKRFDVPGFTLRSLDTLSGALRPIPETLPVRGAVQCGRNG
ncbi:MAG: IgGFc-binding protein [Candidatus Kapabacteria bacterium]|nr:IgGFc-binding protein [Candidatus Kapabacteria bacterium]